MPVWYAFFLAQKAGRYPFSGFVHGREKIAGMAEQESVPEPEESEDDLKQCSVLEKYDGNVLSKLIDRVYIYGDGNLQVVFKNDDYFRAVCEEG